MAACEAGLALALILALYQQREDRSTSRCGGLREAGAAADRCEERRTNRRWMPAAPAVSRQLDARRSGTGRPRQEASQCRMITVIWLIPGAPLAAAS